MPDNENMPGHPGESVTQADTTSQRQAAREHGASTPDQVVDAIKAGILQGRLAPGQRLVEADLTEAHGVSRGPVREALKRLAAEGVLGHGRHRGAFIRKLSRREALELLHVVQALIVLAVREACFRMDQPRNRVRLEAAFSKLSRHAPGAERALQVTDRNAFYDAILTIADNRELARMYPVLPTQIMRMQVYPYLTDAEKQRQFSDYELLYAAMRDGDSRLAQRIAVRHTRRSRLEIRRLPDEAFAPA